MCSRLQVNKSGGLYSDYSQNTSMVGSSSGVTYTALCPTDRVVRSMHLRVISPVVAQIELTCAELEVDGTQGHTSTIPSDLGNIWNYRYDDTAISTVRDYPTSSATQTTAISCSSVANVMPAGIRATYSSSYGAIVALGMTCTTVRPQLIGY